MKLYPENFPTFSSPLRIACLASGNASSFRKVVEAIEEGQLDATAALLISNNEYAPALEFAKVHNIPTKVINRRTEGSFEAMDAKIRDELQAAHINLFILSGYVPFIGPQTRKESVGLNGHPSLLPKHGGKGMVGHKVHEEVWEAKETQTGATIHLVDNELDHGKILAQVEVPVFPNDPNETPNTIEARVKAEEPGLLLATLQAIAGRRITP